MEAMRWRPARRRYWNGSITASRQNWEGMVGTKWVGVEEEEEEEEMNEKKPSNAFVTQSSRWGYAASDEALRKAV